MENLRILVADDEDAVRSALVAMSESLGHRVVAQARNGREAADQADRTSPDLALLDIRMPDMDGLQAARIIGERHAIPVLIVTAHADKSLIEEATRAGAYNYLLKPVTLQSLAAAISTAHARFADLQLLKDEVGDLKAALEARKLVERAKGVLMRNMGVDEQEAYRWLKRASSHHNQKLVDVARRIVALDRPPHR